MFDTAYVIHLLGPCFIVCLLMLPSEMFGIHCDKASHSTGLYCAKPTNSILYMLHVAA